MDSQSFSWHWLKPVLVSSLIFVTLSATVLGFALRSLDPPRLDRVPSSVRWLLVLPSAFAISLVAEVVPRLMFSLLELSINHHLTYRPGFDTVIWQLFAPVFFVMGGVQVAPARKIAAFVILAGIKVAVIAINLTTIATFISGGGGWDRLDPIVGSPLWWNATVYVASALLLSAFGLALVKFPPRVHALLEKTM